MDGNSNANSVVRPEDLWGTDATPNQVKDCLKQNSLKEALFTTFLKNLDLWFFYKAFLDDTGVAWVSFGGEPSKRVILADRRKIAATLFANGNLSPLSLDKLDHYPGSRHKKWDEAPTPTPKVQTAKKKVAVVLAAITTLALFCRKHKEKLALSLCGAVFICVALGISSLRNRIKQGNHSDASQVQRDTTRAVQPPSPLNTPQTPQDDVRTKEIEVLEMQLAAQKELNALLAKQQAQNVPAQKTTTPQKSNEEGVPDHDDDVDSASWQPPNVEYPVRQSQQQQSAQQEKKNGDGFKPVASQQKGDLILLIKDCRRMLRNGIACDGVAWNTGLQPKELAFKEGGTTTDNKGNMDGIYLNGIRFGEAWKAQLEPNHPVSFSLSFSDKSLGGSTQTILKLHLRWDGVYGDMILDNVPIS